METIKTNTKTVELTGEETQVHFSSAFPYFWVRNDGGSTVMMSLSPNVSEGKDGVIDVLAGSSAGTMHGFNDTRSDLYLLGSGRVQIMGTYTPENPFKSARKGGEKKSISAEMGYVSEGLKCHYSADSKNFTGGWRINDLSGNGNAGFFGTMINGFHTEYLENSGGYIFLNQRYIIMPQMDYEQVTLEVVCKFPSTPNYEVDIISNLESGGYCIYYDYNKQQFHPYVRIGGTYRDTAGKSNDYLVHLFTATYDNNTLKFYVDGILASETEIVGNIDFPEDNTVLAINTNPSGGNAQENRLGIGTFNFYSARVYNRALSAAEIMQNFLIDESLFFGN